SRYNVSYLSLFGNGYPAKIKMLSPYLFHRCLLAHCGNLLLIAHGVVDRRGGIKIAFVRKTELGYTEV
ncbi:MAG: hypothetical protein PHR69_07670, partial [Sphaerochaeta sp.]|nr:hypothetical protein [Sphaerochaeta sp.]